MAATNNLIPRSDEMYLVGYALSRATTGDGRPPDWVGVKSWGDAYDLFFEALGGGRSRKSFANSLKNVRDSYDGFFPNARIGWRAASKEDRPPSANRKAIETMAAWDGLSDAVVRDAVLGLLASSNSQTHADGDNTPSLTDETDARRKVLAEVVRRQGQRSFRRALIAAYAGKCAISGCPVIEVLQAAHILPYTGPARNHVTNGLLLRADLHTLFDLRLLKINPHSMTVEIAGGLADSVYSGFQGTSLRLPQESAKHPSIQALRVIYS